MDSDVFLELPGLHSCYQSKRASVWCAPIDDWSLLDRARAPSLARVRTLPEADEADALQDDEDEAGPPPADAEPRVWSRRSFALLPVNSFKRRLVRIHQNVFARQIYKQLHNMDVRGLEAEAFASLFVRDPAPEPFMTGLGQS